MFDLLAGALRMRIVAILTVTVLTEFLDLIVFFFLAMIMTFVVTVLMMLRMV